MLGGEISIGIPKFSLSYFLQQIVSLYRMESAFQVVDANAYNVTNAKDF